MITRIERAHTRAQIESKVENIRLRLSREAVLDAEVMHDIVAAEELLNTPPEDRIGRATSPLSNATSGIQNRLHSARTWLADCTHKGVVSKSVVKRDAGKMLDTIRSHANEPTELKPHLEKLLRHVEVRRERCLTDFDPPTATLSDRWRQLLDVAILFSRYARQHRDIRFLNAALKLGDWALDGGAERLGPEIDARLLLSLAEQEASYDLWSQQV